MGFKPNPRNQTAQITRLHRHASSQERIDAHVSHHASIGHNIVTQPPRHRGKRKPPLVSPELTAQLFLPPSFRVTSIQRKSFIGSVPRSHPKPPERHHLLLTTHPSLTLSPLENLCRISTI
ncbi:Uncharacterized protein Rs2_37663 [Raphanus sativus]|nr:Uncharacterized protein Rs2_37663 [Raphanus sativus]